MLFTEPGEARLELRTPKRVYDLGAFSVAGSRAPSAARSFDVLRVDPELTTERQSIAHHPFHVHGAGRFLILSRDGTPEPNFVWKDTVLVRAGETVHILLEVTNPGRWMAHCHISEHIETGMMFSFEVSRRARRALPAVSDADFHSTPVHGKSAHHSSHR